ncbi:hypothetical protein Tco_0950199 [Tanacetum coccineum]
MIWGRYDTHMVNSQSKRWGLVKYDMGRYGIQLMSIRKGGKELLPSTQSRTFLPQSKAYFFPSLTSPHQKRSWKQVESKNDAWTESECARPDPSDPLGYGARPVSTRTPATLKEVFCSVRMHEATLALTKTKGTSSDNAVALDPDWAECFKCFYSGHLGIHCPYATAPPPDDKPCTTCGRRGISPIAVKPLVLSVRIIILIRVKLVL